jgi:hypothetical protein
MRRDIRLLLDDSWLFGPESDSMSLLDPVIGPGARTLRTARCFFS